MGDRVMRHPAHDQRGMSAKDWGEGTTARGYKHTKDRASCTVKGVRIAESILVGHVVVLVIVPDDGDVRCGVHQESKDGIGF